VSFLRRFLWHYWWGQRQYLQQRLDEIEVEENNLIEDRKRVRARLMKAEAKVIQYAKGV
jgi:hypothetical protein